VGFTSYKRILVLLSVVLLAIFAVLAASVRGVVSLAVSSYLSDGAVTLIIVFLFAAAFAALGSAFAVTAKIILRPIRRLTAIVRSISEGNLDVTIGGDDQDFGVGSELGVLARSLEKMLQTLRHIRSLEELAAQAQTDRTRAEASARAKSEFLAKMSHEIRTPMNAIIGMAELALRENLPSAAMEHIRTIQQAGNNLLSIINDILDFSKIEMRKLEITPAEYQFSSLINDVVSIIRMKTLDTEIRFVVNVDSKIPDRLVGDEVRLRQILLNVLSNAVKYTEKGFVSFSVFGNAAGEDGLITENGIINLMFEVVDTGKGIKQEDLDKLFREFVQVDLESNKGVEGTGLGLAITHGLATAMGGNVTVYSDYGKGSIFTVNIPQTVADPAPLASVSDPETKSVLIYERRDLFAGSLAMTLAGLDVPCTHVVSPEELSEELSANTYRFIFVAAGLMESAESLLSQYGSRSEIVLLTEFGETTGDYGLNIVAMPAYAVSIANILNGVSTSETFSNVYDGSPRFCAPEADVLVVDDIGTNLKVAEGLLSPYKMKVDTCKSGLEAVRLITGKRYHLVLMDHMMPQMNGLEATAKIRSMGGEDPYYSSVPIIALTANAVVGTREMYLANGFDDYLSKPIDTVKLAAMLDKWVPRDLRRQPDGVVQTKGGGTLHDIDGLDVRTGVAMTGGSVENYNHTLSMFAMDAAEKVEELRRCLECNDISLYTTYVHALKSACASIGAPGISRDAADLEAAGKRGDLTYINLHHGKLLEDLSSLAARVSAALNDDYDNMVDVDEDSLMMSLASLKTALEEFDIAAIDSLTTELRVFERNADYGRQILSIHQNILIGEYDAATDTINEMLPANAT
jgi:signal transduction histidine kinase/CheY-like chemotaxis protein/HPt (histidine-containing phosphotransfer) domain-containing protein